MIVTYETVRGCFKSVYRGDLIDCTDIIADFTYNKHFVKILHITISAVNN